MAKAEAPNEHVEVRVSIMIDSLEMRFDQDGFTADWHEEDHDENSETVPLSGKKLALCLLVELKSLAARALVP